MSESSASGPLPPAQEPPAANQTSSDGKESAASDPEPAWLRRQRLAEIFGDVLPEQTSDDRPDGAGGGDQAADRWLREQVPPHHGG